MIHFPSIDNTFVVIALSLLILQTVLIDITTVKGAPDTTLRDYQCGLDTWEMGDPYGTLVEQMLNDLAIQCAQDPNHRAHIEYSYGDIVAYGDATCGPNVGQDDCQACVATAQEFLLTNCPFCKSGWVELVNCYLNYYN